MYIYLMRHGQTDWNVGLRMQGSADIPLNDNGIAQAREAAAGMKQLPLDCILTSPLKRAQQTAEIVAEGRRIPLIIEARLTELDFGALEGVCRKDHPAAWTYFHDPEHYIPCEGGETYAQLDERCADVMAHVLAPLEKTCKNVLVCSHAAFITGIVRRILNRPLRDFWADLPQGNCSVTIAECEKGVFRLVEYGHSYSGSF